MPHTAEKRILTMRGNNPRKKTHTGPRQRPHFGSCERHVLKMFAILADGQPHIEDDVIAASAPLIPPHKAERHAHNQRAAQGLSATVAKQLAIASGQRRIIQQKMRGLERTGNAVRDNGVITLNADTAQEYRQWAATHSAPTS